MVILAIVFAIVPMVIYPMFIYWMDRYEKEPIGLLAGAFLWGFVPAAILSFIVQIVLEFPLIVVDETGTLAGAAGPVLFAPFTEEIFKGIAVLVIYLVWRNEFDGVFDGIIYGSLVGFGFAAVENILYFTFYDPGNIATIVLRAFVFGLNHAFFTSLTGIGFGVARHTRKLAGRLAAPLVGLAGAMAAHFLHNASLTFAESLPILICVPFVSNPFGIILVFVITLVAIRRERQWIIDQLADEVERGTLTRETYATISTPLERWSARMTALSSKGISRWQQLGRYFQTLTELAYRKHAFQNRGEAGASPAMIDELRRKAVELGQQVSG